MTISGILGSRRDDTGYSVDTGLVRRRARAKAACMRGAAILLLILIAGTLVSCANPEQQAAAPVSSTPETRVILFTPAAGHWTLSTIAQVQPGNEFVLNNRLYRSVEAGRVQAVPSVDTGKLFEADRQLDNTSRRPEAADVVQVFGEDGRFAAHAPLSAVQPGSTIRFQGRAYTIGQDRGLTSTGMVFTSAAPTLRRIEITASGLQHVIDRHTAGGSMNAGKSVVNSGESIQALIRNAELLAPVRQARGNCQRVFGAGRPIGTDRATGRQTSIYTVITTESGKLVTAFPGLP